MKGSDESEAGMLRLFGAPYSVYARIARLVLEELGVPYRLEEVDIFSERGAPPGYERRHPFLKIPTLEDRGFCLYETDAIVHYAMAAFGGDSLLPGDPRQRGRAVQIARIIDNYAYPRLVWRIYVPESSNGGGEPVGKKDIDEARRVISAITDLAAEPFLVDERLTLADIWAAPVLTYFQLAPSGQAIMAEAPALTRWLARMRERPSMKATRFPAERD